MPDEVSNLTPEQATAKLAELEAAYRGAPPIAEPRTPAEARLRLETLSQSKEWADQLLAGNAEARRTFASLTELASQASDRLDGVLNGTAEPQPFEVTTPDNPLSTRDLTSAVEGLRDLGIDDELAAGFAKGEKVSPELYREVEKWKARHMSNADWVKRYMANDKEAVWEMTIANMLLAAGIAE